MEIKQSSYIKEGNRARKDLEGLDWWHRSVWLEAPGDELDNVEYVEYILHPTFPNPIQRIADRSTNFRLNSAGWGEFMIYAQVYLRNKKERLEIQHWLQLREPEAATDTTGTTQQKAIAPTGL